MWSIGHILGAWLTGKSQRLNNIGSLGLISGSSNASAFSFLQR